jgi:polyisoprenoid-binding protein YceI
MTSTVDRPPTDAQPPKRRRRRRLLLIVAVSVLVLAGAAGAGIWWFFHGDAPEAVNLESATEQVTETTDTATTAASAVTTATTAATTATSSSAIAGTWTVDTSVGEFSFEDSTGTFVGFRVDEELSGIGSTTAVGRTPEVSGTITIDGTTVTAATIEADLSSITTNDSRRNGRVQEALETSTFPDATFVLSEPIDLGASAASGQAVTVDAIGELTIHGVTKTVTIPLQAQLVNGTVVIVGSMPITFADYGVSVPSSAIVLSVKDNGTLELQLFLQQS